jgi:hypothetical protein
VVPDLPSYGRGNDQEKDQADLRETPPDQGDHLIRAVQPEHATTVGAAGTDATPPAKAARTTRRQGYKQVTEHWLGCRATLPRVAAWPGADARCSGPADRSHEGIADPALLRIAGQPMRMPVQATLQGVLG